MKHFFYRNIKKIYLKGSIQRIDLLHIKKAGALSQSTRLLIKIGLNYLRYI